MKSYNNYKIKELVTRGVGGLCTTIPLLTFILCNTEFYFGTTQRVVSTSIGGSLAAIILVLSKVHKLPTNARYCVKCGVAFAIVGLLQPIIADLYAITGMLFVGSLGDYICDKTADVFKGKAEIFKSANITATVTSEVLKQQATIETQTSNKSFLKGRV